MTFIELGLIEALVSPKGLGFVAALAVIWHLNGVERAVKRKRK